MILKYKISNICNKSEKKNGSTISLCFIDNFVTNFNISIIGSFPKLKKV